MLIKKSLIIVLLVLSAVSNGAIKIVTTTVDLSSLVKTIGGDHVDVTAIAKGTQDPHYVEAKPSFLVAISRADLVISIGLSLESGWLPLLLRGARKPSLLPGQSGFLQVSDAITPIEILESADRSDGDVHPEGNPHFMADPGRVLKVIDSISKKLQDMTPDHAAEFKLNSDKLKKQLEIKMIDWRKRLAKIKNKKVIGYHKSFNYFFDFFGFEAVGYLEPKPGIPPTAQHIIKLTDLAVKKNVKLLIIEDFFDPKPGHTLADKIGAKVVLLPAYVGGAENLKDYIDWFEYLVSQIEKAAE